MRPLFLLLLFLTCTPSLRFNQTHFHADTRRSLSATYEYVLSDGRYWVWDEVEIIRPRLVTLTGCAVASVTQSSTLTFFVLACPAPRTLNASQLMSTATANVEPNHAMQAVGVQVSAPWHLDRIDSTTATYDTLYHFYDLGASSVTIYHIDTGIRATHNEFTGRATAAANTVDGSGPADCNGHGTWTASLAIGITYGMFLANGH